MFAGSSAFVALAVGELLGDFVSAGAALDCGGQAGGDATERGDKARAQWGYVFY